MALGFCVLKWVREFAWSQMTARAHLALILILEIVVNTGNFEAFSKPIQHLRTKWVHKHETGVTNREWHVDKVGHGHVGRKAQESEGSKGQGNNPAIF
jgi:hypothetical protein